MAKYTLAGTTVDIDDLRNLTSGLITGTSAPWETQRIIQALQTLTHVMINEGKPAEPRNVYHIDWAGEGRSPVTMITEIHTAAEKHGVVVLAVSFVGPGGGNPTGCFFATAAQWEAFVRDWYFSGTVPSEDELNDALEPHDAAPGVFPYASVRAHLS